MRILIDTNLWISALLSQTTRQRVGLFIAQPDIILVGSENLISEIKEVINRPKFKRYLSGSIAEQLLQILSERLEMVQVISKVQVCRDPNDDYLLAICHDAQVDYLLTGDKDLLDISVFGQTRIVSLTEFEGSYFPPFSAK